MQLVLTVPNFCVNIPFIITRNDCHHKNTASLLQLPIMNPDDYETLPTDNVGTHMIAGAIAGVMEHCVMYPLDSVKVSKQIPLIQFSKSFLPRIE